MICRSLRIVVYCAGRRPAMVSWISRTVPGPRLHSTVRISSSASVGRGGSAAIYEDLTTITFVCQGLARDGFGRPTFQRECGLSQPFCLPTKFHTDFVTGEGELLPKYRENTRIGRALLTFGARICASHMGVRQRTYENAAITPKGSAQR